MDGLDGLDGQADWTDGLDYYYMIKKSHFGTLNDAR